MDTEAIASEIVSIRSRLREIEDQVEGSVETDADDERTELLDRMRHLQSVLSGHGAGGDQDVPGQPDTVQYVPPA